MGISVFQSHLSHSFCCCHERPNVSHDQAFPDFWLLAHKYWMSNDKDTITSSAADCLPRGSAKVDRATTAISQCQEKYFSLEIKKPSSTASVPLSLWTCMHIPLHLALDQPDYVENR